MGKDRKERTRPPVLTKTMQLVETRSRTVQVSGPLQEMLIKWMEGINDGYSYNVAAGDIVATYLASAYACTAEQAWAAMMVWCESHYDES